MMIVLNSTQSAQHMKQAFAKVAEAIREGGGRWPDTIDLVIPAERVRDIRFQDRLKILRGLPVEERIALAPMHPEEAAFQAQLDANPGDSLCRQVFADWLDERGDIRAAGYRKLGEMGVAPFLDGESAGFHNGQGHDGGDPLKHGVLPQEWMAHLACVEYRKRLDTYTFRYTCWCSVRGGRRMIEDMAAVAYYELVNDIDDDEDRLHQFWPDPSRSKLTDLLELSGMTRGHRQELIIADDPMVDAAPAAHPDGMPIARNSRRHTIPLQHRGSKWSRRR